jgi:hypothetical protein
MVALLLEHGAEADTRNPDGQTPLMLAVSKADTKPAEVLLGHKANVNAHDIGGWTPLHYAADLASNRGDATALVNLLLAAGAEVNARDSNGSTPLKQLLRPTSGAQILESQKAAALLRQHGAVEDLPLMDRIEIRRPTANYSSVVFSKGTNDYNRFSLLELLATHYGFISDQLSPIPPSWRSSMEIANHGTKFNPASCTAAGSLAFPNFEKVILRRPTSDGRGWTTNSLNVSQIFKSGDCSKDVRLEWGDVVEIPEADHPINATWQGLPTEGLVMITNCLKRQIQLTIKGQTTNLVLAPLTTKPRDNWENPVDGTPMWFPPQFTLLPALSDSGLLRASPDLSRVKVHRHDPHCGQSSEVILDCSDSKATPNFWLRDGDAIEVPEKP